MGVELIYPRKVYLAEHRRTVDADTVDVVPAKPIRLRLLGFDAAELTGESDQEEAIGREQAAWVEEWMRDHPHHVADTRGEGPFGRSLAWVLDPGSGECMNLEFVKRWPERARNPRKQMQRLGVEIYNQEQCKPPFISKST